MSSLTNPTNEPRGTIFARKPKGKKLTFCVGGPTLSQAQAMIRWSDVNDKEIVYVHIDDTGLETVLKRPA